MSPVPTLDALSGVSNRIAAIQAKIDSLAPTKTPAGTAASKATTSAATTSARTTAPTNGASFAAALDSAAALGSAAASAVSPTPAATATVTGSEVVASARKYLGVPYVWGGDTPAGLDCSGLVQLAFHDLGIDLPRVSRDQAKAGVAVPSMAQARPGDLIAFGSPVDHIAIYAGDNKIIEAPQPGEDVHITEMYRTPVAIRRIVPPGDPATPTTGGATFAANPVAATDSITAATLANLLTAVTGASTAGVTLGLPPGFPTTVAPADLHDVPRAVPLASLGLSTSSASAAANARRAGGDTLTASQLTAAGLSPAVAAFASDFASAGTKFNLPTGLLAAVAQAESGGDPNAVSSAGAEGLMQLMPATAASLGVTDPFDPQQAIDGAAKLLSQNLSAFGGSLDKALAAYNAGAAAVRRYGGVPPYSETQNYVSTITDMLARLS